MICVTTEAWTKWRHVAENIDNCFSWKHKIGILDERFLEVVSNIPRDNKLVLVEVRAWYDTTLSMARFAGACMCHQPCVNDYL